MKARIAALCGWAAAVCLVAMMLLTVADVVLRATANAPIRGVYELIELLLAGTFFLALPAVFLRDDHIVVNSIDEWLPRALPALKRIAAVLAAGFMAGMAWQGWIAAAPTPAVPQATADHAIPPALPRS